MATIAELLVKIGANSSGLRKELASTQRQMKRAFGSEALAASQKAAGLLGALSAAMGGVGVASVVMAGKMSASRVAFDTLLGDTQKATAFLEDLYQFAAETPFEFEGLQDTAKKLLAFKFAAEDIIPIMTAIGDAAGMLGSGQEGIDRMTLAISQMQSKGKVQSEEMLQLAESGVNAWQYLADSMGMSISEVMDKVSKGEVDAQTGINAIILGMQRDFKGGMERQAKEIPGLWSTILDNTKIVMTNAGEGLIKALGIKEKLQGLAGYLSQFAGYVKQVGIGQALRDMIPPGVSLAILSIAGALTAAATPAMLKFGLTAAKALIPLLPWITVGAAVGAMAWLIWKNWEPLSDLFMGLWDTIYNGVKWAWNGYKVYIFSVIKAILSGIDKLFNMFGAKSPVENMLNSINDALQEATSNMDDAQKTITSGVNKMGGSFDKFGVNTKKAFEEVADGAKKLNTVFSGLKGESNFRVGTKEDAKALEELKKKAEQVSEQIRQEWVQTTKTQLEQLDIWREEQIAALDEIAKGYEEHGKKYEDYQRDLDRINAVYTERRKKILEEENAHQDALDEARKQGKIAAFAEELASERALLAADLAARQEMIDLYYELWQETHRTSMSYMAEAMSGLYSGLTDFFADVINNAKSIGDAWDSLRSKFLTMLGQMVAQWLSSRLMMWAMEKMFGKKQQSQTATQAASTAISWAPAAAMASLASFGGNAAPAMMGISMTTGLAMGLATLPSLATGGITTGPTIAEIGEGRYKEAVLPLNKKYFEKAGLIRDHQEQPPIIFSPTIKALDSSDVESWLENGGGAKFEKYFRRRGRSFVEV